MKSGCKDGLREGREGKGGMYKRRRMEGERKWEKEQGRDENRSSRVGSPKFQTITKTYFHCEK